MATSTVYSLTISGAGVPDDVVRQVFEEAIRALRVATPDDGDTPSGTFAARIEMTADEVDRP